MNMREAALLAQELLDAGYKAEVRPDYSGRFMFGKVTPGIVCNLHPEGFKAAFPRSMREHALRSDNMGMGWVYY